MKTLTHSTTIYQTSYSMRRHRILAINLYQPWTDQNISSELYKHHPAMESMTISNERVQDINALSEYLATHQRELRGVASDGDCWFHAFLASYDELKAFDRLNITMKTAPFSIPILDEQKDRVQYLRELIAARTNISDDRQTQIKTPGIWVDHNEGIQLAGVLGIPIRVITLNRDTHGRGISDTLSFKLETKRRHESHIDTRDWKTLTDREKPKHYICIVDLGGHFVWASSTEFQTSRHTKTEAPKKFISKDPPKFKQDNTSSDHIALHLEKAFTSALHKIKKTIETRMDNNPHFNPPSVFLCYAWGIYSYEQFVRHQLASDLLLAGLDDVILDNDTNQQGDTVRFMSKIMDADLVVVTGTKKLNKIYEDACIKEDDFQMIERSGQRKLLLKYIKDLQIINNDGSIIPNLDLNTRTSEFWDQEQFPDRLKNQKTEVISEIIRRASSIDNKTLVILKELSIIATRQHQPGYSGKTLWIIKDGDDYNALPRQQAGQYPKIHFNVGQFRLKELAALMPSQSHYDNVLKILKGGNYIDTKGTGISIENGIAETTLKTQALIENEIIGDKRPFDIPELNDINGKEAIKELIKTSVKNRYPHHLLSLIRKMNVIHDSDWKTIYAEFEAAENEYIDNIQVTWMNLASKETKTTHQPIPTLIANMDIFPPNNQIVRTRDELNLVNLLKDLRTRIVEITAMGGSGKSCFTREFLRSHQKRYDLVYDQQIWFSFYTLKSRDIMAPFEALLDMIINYAQLSPNKNTTESKRLCVQQYLNTTHTLMVLDGLEIAQKGDITQDEHAKYTKADDVGRFKDPEFARFMIALTHNTKSHVLVSSRVPLRDLRAKNYAVGEGLAVLELSQWTDEEICMYMLSGDGISGDKTQVLPILQIIGRTPLVLSLFKGMLLQNYSGNWSNAKEILTKIQSMIKEDNEDSIYERQLKRIRGIISEIDKKLNEKQRYFLRILCGAYGELTENHFQVLAYEITNQSGIEVRQVIDSLRPYNIITEGQRLGIKSVTAHPMVKMCVMQGLSLEEQIITHETLMNYFQAQPIPDNLDNEDCFDELMEWAHQVATLQRRDGTLQVFSKDPRLGDVRHIALYVRISEIMGRYISQRNMSYLLQKQEIFLTKQTDKLIDINNISDTTIKTTASVKKAQSASPKRTSITRQNSTNTGGEDTVSTQIPPTQAPQNNQNYYESKLSEEAKKIGRNIRDMATFQANLDIINNIITLIQAAKENGVDLKTPSAIVPTVFYAVYVRIITQGNLFEAPDNNKNNTTSTPPYPQKQTNTTTTQSQTPQIYTEALNPSTTTQTLFIDPKNTKASDKNIIFTHSKSLKNIEQTTIVSVNASENFKKFLQAIEDGTWQATLDESNNDKTNNIHWESLVDEEDDDGRTLAHWAGDYGYTTAFYSLLNLGARLSVKDTHNQTPLNYLMKRIDTLTPPEDNQYILAKMLHQQKYYDAALRIFQSITEAESETLSYSERKIPKWLTFDIGLLYMDLAAKNQMDEHYYSESVYLSHAETMLRCYVNYLENTRSTLKLKQTQENNARLRLGIVQSTLAQRFSRDELYSTAISQLEYITSHSNITAEKEYAYFHLTVIADKTNDNESAKRYLTKIRNDFEPAKALRQKLLGSGTPT